MQGNESGQVVPHFTIGGAVASLIAGLRVRREGWNGKSQFLGLQVADENSANTLPYVYIITEQGDRVPWLCSQTDLLATDWVIAEEEV
jgi:hypothetical protein